MHFLSALLFALSANIDNFTVGIAYGIKKIRIQLLSNLLIALITATGTFVSMTIGLMVSRILSPGVANAAGSVILILIGIWVMKDFFRGTRINKRPKKDIDLPACSEFLKEPERADRNHSGTIDLKESLVLAWALTINNFGLGIGASITGLNIYITVGCTFLFSILSISLGYMVGKSCLSAFLGKYSSLVSGMIIILLGIYELII